MTNCKGVKTYDSDQPDATDIEHTSTHFAHKILKTLCIKKEELQGFQIRKQSIDARKKPVLYYVYSVDVQVRDETKVKKTVKNNQIQFQVKPDSYHFEVKGTEELTHRPVIIGTGPPDCSVVICSLRTDISQFFWNAEPM